MPDKKVDEKDLEKISGGMDTFQNDPGAGGGGGGSRSGIKKAVSGPPTGGSPGVHKDERPSGLGENEEETEFGR